MQFIFVLAMVFLGGGLMEAGGMEGILGAFLAGLGIESFCSSCFSFDEPAGVCG